MIGRGRSAPDAGDGGVAEQAEQFRRIAVGRTEQARADPDGEPGAEEPAGHDQNRGDELPEQGVAEPRHCAEQRREPDQQQGLPGGGRVSLDGPVG
jgi:hypothetical protein